MPGRFSVAQDDTETGFLGGEAQVFLMMESLRDLGHRDDVRGVPRECGPCDPRPNRCGLEAEARFEGLEDCFDENAIIVGLDYVPWTAQAVQRVTASLPRTPLCSTIPKLGTSFACGQASRSSPSRGR